MTSSTIQHAQLTEMLANWWFHYDEWNPSALRSLMTDDMNFVCRSDTGETDYEDFIRCDARGFEAVMAWKDDHRANSPYPLRHVGSNIVITARDDGECEFSSYILVTKIVAGRPHLLSTGIVSGVVRSTADGWRFCRMVTILATRDSERYADAVPSR